MKIQRILVALTLVNLTLVLVALAQIRAARAAEEIAPVLRAHALQIVDERGRVRASINVYPAGSREGSDEVGGDTVLLRLITDRGRPSVKLAASEQQTILALIGSSGTKETYLQLGVKGTVSSLRLKNEDGRERVVEP